MEKRTRSRTSPTRTATDRSVIISQRHHQCLRRLHVPLRIWRRCRRARTARAGSFKLRKREIERFTNIRKRCTRPVWKQCVQLCDKLAGNKRTASLVLATLMVTYFSVHIGLSTQGVWQQKVPFAARVSEMIVHMYFTIISGLGLPLPLRQRSAKYGPRKG